MRKQQLSGNAGVLLGGTDGSSTVLNSFDVLREDRSWCDSHALPPLPGLESDHIMVHAKGMLFVCEAKLGINYSGNNTMAISNSRISWEKSSFGSRCLPQIDHQHWPDQRMGVHGLHA